MASLEKGAILLYNNKVEFCEFKENIKKCRKNVIEIKLQTEKSHHAQTHGYSESINH